MQFYKDKHKMNQNEGRAAGEHKAGSTQEMHSKQKNTHMHN